MQVYDPHQLVEDVMSLLRDHGVEPRLDWPVQAASGAGMLLRALGVTPAMDQVRALTRAMDKPWPENDDALAEWIDRGTASLDAADSDSRS